MTRYSWLQCVVALTVAAWGANIQAQHPSISSVLNSALAQTDGEGDTDGSGESSDDDEQEAESGEGAAAPIPTTPEIQPPTLLELQAAILQLQSELSTHRTLLENQTAISRDLAEQIRENRESITNNVGALSDLLDQQQKILDSISRQDSEGRYLPRLDANMSNPEFAEEVRSVVQRVQPERGTLVIRNTLPYDQLIVVNGEQHRVVANAFLTLRLPVGNVETRVPGGQSVNWFLGAPNYEQRIRLAY